MSKDRPIRRGDGYVVHRTTTSGEDRYLARWHDGTRWCAKTFPDEDDAYDHLRAMGRKRRRGGDTSVSQLTVAELLDDYIERGQHRWTANTVATYTLIVKRQIVPWLGTIRIVDLSATQVQRWLDRRTDQVSASVLQSARTILSGACKEALRLGILATNPVAGAQPPARKRTHRVTWNAAQVRAVLAEVSDDILYHAFYLVALTTGVRPGELRALMWSDVDLDRGVLTVRRSMTRDANFRHQLGAATKTGRVRSIALPDITVAALNVHRNDQQVRRRTAKSWIERGIVFDRGDGTPLAQQTVANRHRAICERSGVPRIRMHDMRHGFATMLLEQGTHPKIVADMLGHATVATTLDTYSHVDVDMQRAASRSLTDAIAGTKPKRNRVREKV